MDTIEVLNRTSLAYTEAQTQVKNLPAALLGLAPTQLGNLHLLLCHLGAGSLRQL